RRGGAAAVTPSGKERGGRLASRAVQAAFLIALVTLWYLATTRWRVSPLLLPNPVAVLRDFWDILRTGEFIGDLRVTLAELAGFGYVDKMPLVEARSMGASDVQLFRYVLLPAALPIMLTGMRMGFTVALLSIIGSETIASLAGLGHRIVHLAEAMEMAPMFAYIAFVVAIAAILNVLVSMLEARGQRPRL